MNFQLWQASDYDHRIAPQKFLTIVDMSRRVISAADELEVEVEYQQGTVGKFGLDFDGSDFILVNTQTDCRAKDSCDANSTTAWDRQLSSQQGSQRGKSKPGALLGTQASCCLPYKS